MLIAFLHPKSRTVRVFYVALLHAHAPLSLNNSKIVSLSFCDGFVPAFFSFIPDYCRRRRIICSWTTCLNQMFHIIHLLIYRMWVGEDLKGNVYILEYFLKQIILLVFFTFFFENESTNKIQVANFVVVIFLLLKKFIFTRLLTTC